MERTNIFQSYYQTKLTLSKSNIKETNLNVSKVIIDIPEEQPYQDQLSPNKENLLKTLKESLNQLITPQNDEKQKEIILKAVQQLSCQSQTQQAKTQKQKEDIMISLPLKAQTDLSIQPLQKINSCNIRPESSRPRIQREKLIKRIQEAIEFLVRGIEVDRYCFRWKKIERAVLFFSEDVHFMGLHRVINGSTRVVNMKQCQGITTGIKTQRLKEYQESGYPIKEQTAISLLFPDRSYDFTVSCQTLRNRLVRELKFLWQQSHQK